MANVVYLNRSLSYFDIDSHYDHPRNRFYLSIQFDVRERLRIESDIVRPIETRISIINLTFVLTLTSSNNNEKKEIIMTLLTQFDPLQLYITLGSNVTFYKQIDRSELENLLEWRRGGDVTVKWSFYGNGLADMNGHTILVTLSFVRGGGEAAALEIMGRIKSIMENIYKISSKPAHTELERGGLKFEMNTDKEDALFVFESSVCLLTYFLEKFKKLN